MDITPTEAYKLFLEEPDSFKTSAASPEECLDALRTASRKAESILCVTISNKLSMQHDSVQHARRMAENALSGVRVEVLDSLQATSSEGMVALAAARAAAEGKDMEEVIRAAEYVRDNVRVVMFLDTLRHVYRSGRIPKIASKIGAALNIKPMLTVNGTVRFLGIARTRKQGIERIMRMLRNEAGTKPVHVAVTHAYALEEAEKLKDRIASEFNCTELWLSEFSPVMGYACGTGTIGISFYTDG